MNQLEELVSEIHKKCPELLELTRGCVVLVEFKGVRVNAFTILARNWAGNYLVDTGNGVTTTWPSKKFKQVIGHPIGLEHVLKRMGATDYNGNGWAGSADVKKLLGLWQLGKPLHEQSIETILFLSKLFKNT